MSGSTDDLPRTSGWARLWNPPAASGLGFSPVSVPCAVLGFLLVMAAEFLPWFTVTVSNGDSGSTLRSVGLASVPTLQTITYYPLWAVIFALVAVAVAVPGPVRRIAGAAGVGLLAGQAMLLLSLSRPVTTQDSISVTRHLEQGFYCALAAVLAVLAAVLFSGRTRRPRLSTVADVDASGADWRSEPEAPASTVVLELTVTPAGTVSPIQHP
jgi:hypothetical protein